MGVNGALPSVSRGRRDRFPPVETSRLSMDLLLLLSTSIIRVRITSMYSIIYYKDSDVVDRSFIHFFFCYIVFSPSYSTVNFCFFFTVMSVNLLVFGKDDLLQLVGVT